MSLLEMMENRYSCRRYSDEAISKEDIQAILEAGRLAPTSHNIQPQRIFVIQSPVWKEKLLKNFSYNFKAPCFIVCGYDTREVWKNELNDFKDSGDIDVSVVMTHMMLMAESLGLGVCWIGHFDPNSVRENLRIPEYIKLVGIFNIGHHRADDKPSRLHYKKKEQDEFIRFL